MKKILVLALVLSFTSMGYAEPIRTVLTKENRFPGENRLEIGTMGRYVELDNADLTAITPYARYGVLDHLAIFGTVPFERISPDMAGSESGLGDVSTGFELRTFEDIFGYPWIIPHFEVSFDTGDDDKGLGAGQTIYTLGIAAGTTVADKVHWAADARYRILDDESNIPSIAGSIVWDLDKQFSLMGEIEVSRDRDQDQHPILFLGGMYYKATPSLHFGLHGGTTTNSDEDVVIHGKVAYTF